MSSGRSLSLIEEKKSEVDGSHVVIIIFSNWCDNFTKNISVENILL